MGSTISSQILDKVNKLGTDFEVHLAYDKDNRQKITDMYKILVIGNGDLPLPETVRKHNEWIEKQEKEQNNIKKYNEDEILQSKKYSQEELLQSKKDIITDKNETVAFKRQLWLLASGQVLTLIGLGVAVFLKLK